MTVLYVIFATLYVTATRNQDLNVDLVFKKNHADRYQKVNVRQIAIMAPSALLIVHCDYGLFQSDAI